LWYASPYIELMEGSLIQSSSGWLATIEYKGKGYFSGKAHSFKAVLTPPANLEGHTKHTYEGQWSHISHDLETGELFTDVTGPKEEVSVKPLDEMEASESRKLWRLVANGIRHGDFETASREKSKIEHEQRQRRKDELAHGTPWQLRYFTHLDHDPHYETLGKYCNVHPSEEDTYVFKGA